MPPNTPESDHYIEIPCHVHHELSVTAEHMELGTFELAGIERWEF